MRLSRFTVVVELGNGLTAFSNTLTGRSVLVRDHVAPQISPWLDGRRIPNILGALDWGVRMQRAGIIHGDDVDELEIFRRRSQQELADETNARLLMVVTRDCNLRCWYCYQKAGRNCSGVMSMATAERVARFARQLLNRRPTTFAAGFYGGEPLTNVEVCDLLAEEISRAAARADTFLQFPLITNGYLLAELSDHAVVRLAHAVHLTIDGDPDCHDRVRVTRDGERSYTRLLEGLRVIRDMGKYAIIRIHGDRLSAQGLRQILDDVRAAGIRSGTATIYVIGLDRSAHECWRDQCSLPQESLEDQARESALSDVLRGEIAGHPLADMILWNRDEIGESNGARFVACVYERASSYIVDYSGHVVLCPVSLDQDIRGTLAPSGEVDWAESKQHERPARFDNPICTACAFLPKCGGNCLLQPRPAADSDCSSRRAMFTEQIRRSIIESQSTGSSQCAALDSTR